MADAAPVGEAEAKVAETARLAKRAIKVLPNWLRRCSN